MDAASNTGIVWAARADRPAVRNRASVRNLVMSSMTAGQPFGLHPDALESLPGGIDEESSWLGGRRPRSAGGAAYGGGAVHQQPESGGLRAGARACPLAGPQPEVRGDPDGDHRQQAG